VEAKTAFDVILVSAPPDKKIAVIKAVREVKAGLGLLRPKLEKKAPKPVSKGRTRLMRMRPRRNWKRPVPKWKSVINCLGVADFYRTPVCPGRAVDALNVNSKRVRQQAGDLSFAVCSWKFRATALFYFLAT
jgi:hypothetical protein